MGPGCGGMPREAKSSRGSYSRFGVSSGLRRRAHYEPSREIMRCDTRYVHGGAERAGRGDTGVTPAINLTALLYYCKLKVARYRERERDSSAIRTDPGCLSRDAASDI